MAPIGTLAFNIGVNPIQEPVAIAGNGFLNTPNIYEVISKPNYHLMVCLNRWRFRGLAHEPRP